METNELKALGERMHELEALLDNDECKKCINMHNKLRELKEQLDHKISEIVITDEDYSKRGWPIPSRVRLGLGMRTDTF